MSIDWYAPNVPEPMPAHGLDGKTYNAKSATPTEKPRRLPLGDAAERAGWELRKVVERIERIFADDRFNANEEQVSNQLDGQLSYTVEICQDLLDRLSRRRATPDT
jgi:hypothetical protein